jgi:hypothetical protein
MTARNIVVQGPAFTQRDTDHFAFGAFCCFANSLWHFAGFTMSKSDTATLVTNNHKGGEAKTTATFHNFSDTINMDQTVDKFAIALVAIVTVFFSCHGVSPLNQLRS